MNPSPKRLVAVNSWLYFIFLLTYFATTSSSRCQDAPSGDLPSAAGVWERVVARNNLLQTNGSKTHFLYLRHSVQEELDSTDRVTKKEEKVYEVTLSGNETRSRLVKINGKTPADKPRTGEKEDNRSKGTDGKKAGRQRRGGVLITEEMIAKFDHRVDRREKLGGRSCVVISFTPKSSGVEVDQMSDRVLNRLQGEVWVDEEEAEVAKLDVRLIEKVSVWGGLLGSIEAFNVMLVRARSKEGVWFNEDFNLFVEGRKLLESMRMRIREKSTDFRKGGS